MDKFAQQLQDVRQLTLTLNQRAEKSIVPQDDLVVQAFKKLDTALEELRVLQEQIRQQKQELATIHQVLETDRQRYLELFEYAPEAYIVTDCYGKILLANRASAHLLKLPPQCIKGKALIRFVPQQEIRAFCLQMLRLRQIEQLQEWEINLKTFEGVKFNAAISVTTFGDPQGNQIGWRWLIRNITPRKQAEEQLRSIQIENWQVQESARLKSQFMAMVSHELRTPMNAILGFTQLLLRQPYNQLPNSSKMMVERIFHSGKHLLQIIEDMLDFSALTTSNLSLIENKFNLAELIIKTVEELRPLAQYKNLNLNLSIELQNPIITNDQHRVRQILINLLDNAIKFTDAGSVSVEVREVNQDRIALIVKDTGIGIPQTDVKHIFQEFRQINQSITRRHGGTGLGLAIVDKLLRLMKGTINVETCLGKGSTFYVQIPRNVIGH